MKMKMAFSNEIEYYITQFDSYNRKTSWDMLRLIPHENLIKLRNLYEKHQDLAPHVHSVLSMAITWQKIAPHKNYLTFHAIGSDYLQTGSFLLFYQFNCYDFFVFTLEKSPETLRKALSSTDKLDWTKTSLFYAVSSRLSRTICDVLTTKNVRYYSEGFSLFGIPKETALKFEITTPKEVYLAEVGEAHVDRINEAWPHKYEGSGGYIGTLVRMNGGLGVFLKDGGELVAWVVQNYFGQIGFLQTADGYKRRGYAAFLVKVLARRIAEEGHNPCASVIKGNVASEGLLTKLGFANMDDCFYIETNPR